MDYRRPDENGPRVLVGSDGLTGGKALLAQAQPSMPQHSPVSRGNIRACRRFLLQVASPGRHDTIRTESPKPMPTRNMLRWITRSRQAQPEAPPLPAAPDPAPMPHEPAPSPRILLLGAEPRAVGLIELYRLVGHPDVVLADRRPERAGGDLNGHRVLNFDGIALDRLEATIVTEDPIGEYAEPIAFLLNKGLSPAQVITCAEPGRAHRTLTGLVPTSEERSRQIGYRAVRQNLFHRGHYAYCMVLAAETALRMSLSKVTIVEFGVWYGAGLNNLCEIADFLQQTLGVEFRIFGFDTGAGLPEVADWRDHPELWGSGTLAMPNFEELATQLPPNCRLIIGDCKNTLAPFLREHGSAEAPIGFVSLDVDQYHSSVSALRLFDAEAAHLAPVIPVWVDDSYLNVLQTSYAGEGLAIREFNERHPLRKIEQKIIRTDDFPRLWHHCIYFAHVFDHPVRQGKVPARFDQFYHTNY